MVRKKFLTVILCAEGLGILSLVLDGGQLLFLFSSTLTKLLLNLISIFMYSPVTYMLISKTELVIWL